MKKISRKEAIYQLALAGISAAIALLFVGLSVLVRFSTVAFYIAAGGALMVPLTKKYYLSSIFAYVVSGALGFLIAGDIYTVIGYIAYFGPMAIITGTLCNLNCKWYIAYPIKIIYMNGALALLYFGLKTIIIDSSIADKIPYVVIALVGTIILLVIDIIVQMLYKKLVPLMQKFLREKEEEQPAEKLLNDEEPFEDELFESEIYAKTSEENGVKKEESTCETGVSEIGETGSSDRERASSDSETDVSDIGEPDNSDGKTGNSDGGTGVSEIGETESSDGRTES